MLKIINTFRQLDIKKLMELYAEGNAENAEYFYPAEAPGVALAMAEQEFTRYLKEDFFKNINAFYAVWTADDLWLSALRIEPYKEGVLLEALETHPDHRGKGYATALVKAVQKLLSVPVYSHVSKNNAASLAVHRSCGFRILKDYAVYVDGSVSNQAFTLYYNT